MKKARIIETGSYYPEVEVDNFMLEKHMDTNDEWIVQRTGISSRRFSNLTTSQMAYRAALDVIERSNIDKNDVDLIIVATFTPDNFTPSCANDVARLLELDNDIPSFDINAACSGYIYALQVARGLIESNIYQTILIVGAENISRHLDFNDRSCAILFGDGAGATLITSDEVGVIDTKINNKPDYDKTIIVPNGVSIKTPFTTNLNENKTTVSMKGQEVFKFATSVFVKEIKEVLKKNNLSIDDIAYIIPHQANVRIIETAIKLLKIDSKKVYVNLDKMGNTSAASIPIALDELYKSNKIKRNDKIILIAFGSGLTYGVSLIEW